jgi:DNA-directed RNA polymerase specialized sigma24 family protein
MKESRASYPAQAGHLLPGMPPTLWTLILTAQDREAPDAQVALSRLCEMYWYPLYVFIRRQGRDHHQAQDLTQGFFEHLFKHDWLASVSRDKGRFRTFLLCSLSHYVTNERARELTVKRGGQISQFVSWEQDLAESRYRAEPETTANSGYEFDRLWGCVVADKAFALLKDEYRRCGKADFFETLSPFMTRPIPAGFYADAAPRLNTTEGALRIALHRLLQRFGELLRAEVAQTVAEPAQVDDELREVLMAWSREK